MMDGFDQDRLTRARVLIAGLGGLGSAVSIYLAAAGVGTLILVDGDRVEMTNYNRQILHGIQDLGKSKVLSAMESLSAINPEITLIPKDLWITPESLAGIDCPDVIVDCLDSIRDRLVLNGWAVQKRIPLISAQVEGLEGRFMSILPGKTACLACIYKGEPGSRTPPILGTTAGLLGIMEAQEVLAILAELYDPSAGNLHFVDMRSWSMQTVTVNVDPFCTVCSTLRNQ